MDQRKDKDNKQREQDERITTGASATMSNVGPKHMGVPDTEAMDAAEGTTSDRQQAPNERGVQEKPLKGSRESGDL